MRTTPGCEFRNHKNVYIREKNTGAIYYATNINAETGLVTALDINDEAALFLIDDIEIIQGQKGPNINGGPARYNADDYYPKIREYRKLYELSGRQLAHILEIPASTYFQYESGYYNMSMPRLRRLAEFYGIRFEDLLENNDEKEPIKILSSEAMRLAETAKKKRGPYKKHAPDTEELPGINTAVQKNAFTVSDFIMETNAATKISIFDVQNNVRVYSGYAADLAEFYRTWVLVEIQMLKNNFDDEKFFLIKAHKAPRG